MLGDWCPNGAAWASRIRSARRGPSTSQAVSRADTGADKPTAKKATKKSVAKKAAKLSTAKKSTKSTADAGDRDEDA